MTSETFTAQQIANWRAFEKVRSGGKWNMFDPRAKKAIGLSDSEFLFVMRNYSKLKAAAEAKKTE